MAHPAAPSHTAEPDSRSTFVSPYYEEAREQVLRGREDDRSAAHEEERHGWKREEPAERSAAVHGSSPASFEGRPELIPVPASVFDDDFFRKPNDELRASAPAVSGWPPEPTRDEAVPAAVKLREEETRWPEAKVLSFAGYAGDTVRETDELDIPAFLRRSH